MIHDFVHVIEFSRDNLNPTKRREHAPNLNRRSPRFNSSAAGTSSQDNRSFTVERNAFRISGSSSFERSDSEPDAPSDSIPHAENSTRFKKRYTKTAKNRLSDKSASVRQNESDNESVAVTRSESICSLDNIPLIELQRRLMGDQGNNIVEEQENRFEQSNYDTDEAGSLSQAANVPGGSTRRQTKEKSTIAEIFKTSQTVYDDATQQIVLLAHKECIAESSSIRNIFCTKKIREMCVTNFLDYKKKNALNSIIFQKNAEFRLLQTIGMFLYAGNFYFILDSPATLPYISVYEPRDR